MVVKMQVQVPEAKTKVTADQKTKSPAVKITLESHQSGK